VASFSHRHKQSQPATLNILLKESGKNENDYTTDFFEKSKMFVTKGEPNKVFE
jgi:hypothetical protein